METRALIRPATDEEMEVFSSLRGRCHPEGTFIGDGDKVVRRMLRTTRVRQILCTPDWVEKLPIPSGIEVLTAPLSRMISIVGFRLHQGLMGLGEIPAEKPMSGTFHLALDGLGNAENVGAILRSCAAFGVDGVILGPGSRWAARWSSRCIPQSIWR
jgi:tRNA G18 (ribose-2'-O)-methylase SpoU